MGTDYEYMDKLESMLSDARDNLTRLVEAADRTIESSGHDVNGRLLLEYESLREELITLYRLKVTTTP